MCFLSFLSSSYPALPSKTMHSECKVITFGEVAEVYIAAHRTGWRNGKHSRRSTAIAAEWMRCRKMAQAETAARSPSWVDWRPGGGTSESC